MKVRWEKVKLVDLTDRINGLWKGKKGPFIDVEVYSMSNFTKESELDHNTEPRKIRARASQYEKRKLNFGDILIEKSGGGPNQPVGRAVLFDVKNGKDNTFSNFTTRLRIKKKYIDNLIPQYLHKFLKFLYLKGETEKFQSNSTNIRNLKLKEYLAIKIPIPPLPEQKRIVSLLDEAFAAIDQAQANIERNIENAEELFQSKLSSIFSNLKEETKTLNELCKIVGGGTPSKKNKEYYGGTIPWATVRDMNHDILKVTDHSITKKGTENSSTNIIPSGNVVIATRVGLGKVCILDQDTAINQDLKGIIPKTNDLLPEYLFIWFKSIADDIVAAGTGSTVQGVKLPFVKSLRLPKPEINRQKEIINLYDKLRHLNQQLIIHYKLKLKDIEELKKSLLQKAFSGELTAKEEITA